MLLRLGVLPKSETQECARRITYVYLFLCLQYERANQRQSHPSTASDTLLAATHPATAHGVLDLSMGNRLYI